MAKKKTSVPKVRAEAIAKAELVAKATYQRKHSITEEIPPDVTREGGRLAQFDFSDYRMGGSQRRRVEVSTATIASTARRDIA